MDHTARHPSQYTAMQGAAFGATTLNMIICSSNSAVIKCFLETLESSSCHLLNPNRCKGYPWFKSLSHVTLNVCHTIQPTLTSSNNSTGSHLRTRCMEGDTSSTHRLPMVEWILTVSISKHRNLQTSLITQNFLWKVCSRRHGRAPSLRV